MMNDEGWKGGAGGEEGKDEGSRRVGTMFRMKDEENSPSKAERDHPQRTQKDAERTGRVASAMRPGGNGITTETSRWIPDSSGLRCA